MKRAKSAVDPVDNFDRSPGRYETSRLIHVSL